MNNADIIKVGNRRLTPSLARQLDRVDFYDNNTELLGRLNISLKPAGLWLLAEHPDGTLVVVRRPDEAPSERLKTNARLRVTVEPLPVVCEYCYQTYGGDGFYGVPELDNATVDGTPVEIAYARTCNAYSTEHSANCPGYPFHLPDDWEDQARRQIQAWRDQVQANRQRWTAASDLPLLLL